MRRDLPETIACGDILGWMNAGAYHLSWETRFSHGLAPIAWIDEGGTMSLARARETFDRWWDR